MNNDQIALIAAIMSAVAAIAAAIATWRGPLAAANLAETLRRTGENVSEQRRMKLYIFTTIMQERARTWSADCVRAFNLIDVVFAANQKVRDAWASCLASYDGARAVPAHEQETRLHALLREIALDLGMSENLRLDDFARVYYPTALLEENRLQDLQRRTALAQLQGGASPSANTATSQVSVYPARPPPPTGEAG